MSGSSLLAATPWLALPLMLAVLTACCVALLSRSLFVACLCLLSAGATGTAILLLLNGGVAAPEFALLGVAWAPLMLIGATVLSKRAAKARRRPAWLSLVLGACAATALSWAALSDTPTLALEVKFDDSASALWLAPVFLVLGIAAMALAGFGERGALEHPGEGR
ncbi:MAG: hypothetical protein ABL883_10745 [Terricaulis sp.]